MIQLIVNAQLDDKYSLDDALKAFLRETRAARATQAQKKLLEKDEAGYEEEQGQYGGEGQGGGNWRNNNAGIQGDGGGQGNIQQEGHLSWECCEPRRPFIQQTSAPPALTYQQPLIQGQRGTTTVAAVETEDIYLDKGGSGDMGMQGDVDEEAGREQSKWRRYTTKEDQEIWECKRALI
ncbi:hypothetical protein BGX38DRAFT_906062 [Terfezia claveryi]|nr:hypothetical protein BGX38DRAFT_906062 [Terfezia claveryi]